MLKDILVLVLIGVIGWFAYTLLESPIKQFLGLEDPATVRLPAGQFKCDHRIYCAQMTSCEEARYFLSHCSLQEIDADVSPIACEKRWCK
jgi:hypothetical protein